VVSTHLQDAGSKVADVLWRPNESRLVSRSIASIGKAPRVTGRNTVAALACASSASSPANAAGLDPAGKDAVLNFLAVEFAETDRPVRHVSLIFSGGAVLRLDVECLEAELADLGPV